MTQITSETIGVDLGRLLIFPGTSVFLVSSFPLFTYIDKHKYKYFRQMCTLRGETEQFYKFREKCISVI